MATHTRKKCPHCGRTYESYSTYTKQYHAHSGTPFIKCKYCGGNFVDKDIKEPALKPESANNITILNCIFALFMPFGVGGILFTIVACNIGPSAIGVWVAAILLSLIYLASVIYLLIKRKVLNEKAAKDYEESYKRLKNPEYARALKDAGFDVPRWFLKD